MEPGPVEPGAGSSSDDIRSSATLTVTGDRRVFDASARAFLSIAETSAQRGGMRGTGLPQR